MANSNLSMKHPFSVVVLLLVLFSASQAIGLLILDSSIDVEKTQEIGVTSFKDLPGGVERPSVAPDYSFLLIFVYVIIGTLIMLLIVKAKVVAFWKIWYFLAVAYTLFLAWGALMPALIAGVSGALFSFLKTFRPNFIVHNFTELFLYSGLALLLVPIINVFSASLLLIGISIYDYYAVFKSKHMIKLAKFQMASKSFAGFSVPKVFPESILKNNPSMRFSKENFAIVGGGDVAFPLLFSGAVLSAEGIAKAAVVSFFALLGLALLFYISKRKKFYPAMPFIAAGCFLGYAIVLMYNWSVG